MKIGILVKDLFEGDAVSNDVVGQYISLKKAGHQPFLYADRSYIQLPVDPVANIVDHQFDLFIYHPTVGWELGVKAFKELKTYKVMRYHNITPPKFFEEPIKKRCEDGLAQLPSLLEQCNDIWADSQFNGMDLQNFRKTPFKVIPPYNQADLLMSLVEAKLSLRCFNQGYINVIVVGRVVPNKDIILAVEGFSKYYAKNKQSRLTIIGQDITPSYSQKVKQRITELGLPGVVITGKVPIETLAALYSIADVLLVTSQHEGFCVPMVEAMALGIPVVSNDKCALPYTGEDAVFYATNPDSIAIGIEHVLNNKEEYTEKGLNLFRTKYQNSIVETGFLSAVNSIY